MGVVQEAPLSSTRHHPHLLPPPRKGEESAHPGLASTTRGDRSPLPSPILEKEPGARQGWRSSGTLFGEFRSNVRLRSGSRAVPSEASKAFERPSGAPAEASVPGA